MLRSLYSGVSGMRSNQTKMDVIGNNIANSSTTGFKAGRVRFQDMLSQTVANAQSPNAGSLGGVNAQQIGLGVKVGSIDTIMTGGVMQATNRNLDFAIEGEGFFILSQGGTTGTSLYSRDGAFYRDNGGNLVSSGGYRVMGYQYDLEALQAEFDATLPADQSQQLKDDLDAAKAEKGPSPLKIPNVKTVKAGTPAVDTEIKMESYAIDGSGRITGVYSDGKTYCLGKMAVAKFENPEGLEKLGNSNYSASNNSGAAEVGKANANGYGIIRSGALEMSNVDLANEFTELIVTSRSYQANSRTITTSDEMLQELINLKR